MTTTQKKIAKVLYQIHWALNIAPSYNGVGGKQKVVNTNHWGKRDESGRYNETVNSPTKPVYSLDLVTISNRLVKRYHKIA